MTWLLTVAGLDPAANVDDFTSQPFQNTVTFDVGQPESEPERITIEVAGDNTEESNEKFRVFLDSVTVENGTVSAEAEEGVISTILNDDGPVAQVVVTGPESPTSDVTPTFTWNAVANASRYELWLRNVTTGEDNVIREDSITATSFTAPTALPVADYFVWVRAINSEDEGGSWRHADALRK